MIQIKGWPFSSAWSQLCLVRNNCITHDEKYISGVFCQYTFAHFHLHLHTRNKHTYVSNTYAHIHIHAHTSVQAHSCAHNTHTHIYTHTHTHTFAQVVRSKDVFLEQRRASGDMTNPFQVK